MNPNSFFFKIHKGLPRQGLGSNTSTKKAYSLLSGLSESPKILDIGCGPGMQTIQLAKLSQGQITAGDLHMQYLEELKSKAKKENLSNRIRTLELDMFDLQFEPASFDIIWAEGSIYIIGFDRGIKEWKPFIKDGGYLAVTEISWLIDSPPKEVL